MKTVGLIVLAFVVIVAISLATGQNSTPQKPKTPEQLAAEAAGEARFRLTAAGIRQLRSIMRDPESFRLSRAVMMDNGAACLVYRARNGFGGMNVGLAVVLPDGQLVPLPEDGGSMWKEQCDSQKGYNRTSELADAADVENEQ